MARKKTPPNPLELELRREVKIKFQEAMNRRGITTQAEAARQIGVRKATFNLYMKEKTTPSSFVLLKACEKWGLSIRYGGIEFSSTAFIQHTPQTKMPEQRSLFEALNNLTEKGIDIKIGNRGPDSVRLNLQIRFAAS